MKEMKRENRFSDMLRNLISQYGITQTELARNLGLKPNTISMYCSGNSRPDMDTLLEIASYFNVSIDYLITGEREENKILREELGLSEKSLENLSSFAKSENKTLSEHVDKILSDKEFYEFLSRNIEVSTEQLEDISELEKIRENEKSAKYANAIRRQIIRDDANHMRTYFNIFYDKIIRSEKAVSYLR